MDFPITVEDLRTVGLLLAVWVLFSLSLALLLLALVLHRLRRIQVPPGAGYGETLLYTPLLLAVAIDLLDLALDVLAAPITWLLLDRLGLRALRNVSTVEALIPLTGPIPVLTLSWIWVRLFGPDLPLSASKKYVEGSSWE